MSINILLADDSITIQKVIGIIFGGEDYSLTVVDNGKAAVEKALEIIPDILLIDALMPGMSGYEVCERIRSIPVLSAKPILLLTGSFEPFDETKAKSCGADDFIAKPFESQQIIAKVTELFERAATRTPEAPLEEPTIAPAPGTPFITQEPPPLPIPELVAKPTDIWEAASNEEPASESVFQPLKTVDEPDSAPQPFEPSSFPWVQVDDQAISFEDETLSASPASPFSGQAKLDKPTFGEISFEADVEPVPVQPETETIADTKEKELSPDDFTLSEEPFVSFETVPAEVAIVEETVHEDVIAVTDVPVDVPVVAAAPAMTEEQLRAAITEASRDVIERIVWEVVPDLAEAMIKEAIRRIKEGQ